MRLFKEVWFNYRPPFFIFFRDAEHNLKMSTESTHKTNSDRFGGSRNGTLFQSHVSYVTNQAELIDQINSFLGGELTGVMKGDIVSPCREAILEWWHQRSDTEWFNSVSSFLFKPLHVKEFLRGQLQILDIAMLTVFRAHLQRNCWILLLLKLHSSHGT